MKHVAVIATLIFAAATAATVLIQSSRERAASLEQARAQHEELMRGLARLEQRLAALPAGRMEATQTTVSAGPPAAAGATPARSAKETTAAADSDARKSAQHSDHLQAGNAVVDRAIQVGRWGHDDMAAFSSATTALSGAEKADILARLSAAINADRVQLDVRPRAP